MTILREQRNTKPPATHFEGKTLGILVLATLGVGFLVFQYNVSLVFGAVMLLGLGALIFSKPETATLIVIFAIYINLPVVAIKHGVPRIVATSFFLLLSVPLLSYLFVHRQKLIFNRIFWVMVVYLLVQIASAIFSMQATESLDRIDEFLTEGIVLYFLVVNTIRTSALLRKVLWTLILAGCLMGGLSLYQSITGSYRNSFGGLALLANATVSDEEGGERGSGRPRLAGPVGEQNRYAQIMVMLLPLAVSRIWGERSRLLRIAGALACIPIMGGVTLSFSRGAFVSLVIVTIVMLIMQRAKVLPLLGVTVFIGFFVFAMVPEYVHRISSMAGLSQMASGNSSTVDGAVRGRTTQNLATLNIFFDYPVLGVGPGQTQLYIARYATDVGMKRIYGSRRAHNMYLEELADTGVIGFVVFMAIVVFTLSALLKTRRYWVPLQPEFAHIATGFFLALIGYLGCAIFLHLSYARYYWLMLGVAGAAIEVLRPTDSGQYVPYVPTVEMPAATESKAAERESR